MTFGSQGVAAAIALVAISALACGYCVEDKVAAAYDHAVVERAFARQHEVAFLSLELTRPATKDTEVAIRHSIEGIAGVDRGTVRIALEAGALSMAFDPRRVAPGSVLSALDRELAPLGVRTALLRFGNPGAPSPTRSGVAADVAAMVPSRLSR
jgi:hypothetical protein